MTMHERPFPSIRNPPIKVLFYRSNLLYFKIKPVVLAPICEYESDLKFIAKKSFLSPCFWYSPIFRSNAEPKKIDFIKNIFELARPIKEWEKCNLQIKPPIRWAFTTSLLSSGLSLVIVFDAAIEFWPTTPLLYKYTFLQRNRESMRLMKKETITSYSEDSHWFSNNENMQKTLIEWFRFKLTVKELRQSA